MCPCDAFLDAYLSKSYQKHPVHTCDNVTDNLFFQLLLTFWYRLFQAPTSGKDIGQPVPLPVHTKKC